MIRKIFTYFLCMLLILGQVTPIDAQCGGGAGLFSGFRARRAARQEARQSQSQSQSYQTVSYQTVSQGYQTATYGSGCSGGFAQGFAPVQRTFVVTSGVNCGCVQQYGSCPCTTTPTTTVVSNVDPVNQLISNIPARQPVAPVFQPRIRCDGDKCYIISQLESDAGDVILAAVALENSTSVTVTAEDELLASIAATNELAAAVTANTTLVRR